MLHRNLTTLWSKAAPAQYKMLKDNPYSVLDPIYQMNTHLYQAALCKAKSLSAGSLWHLECPSLKLKWSQHLFPTQSTCSPALWVHFKTSLGFSGYNLGISEVTPFVYSLFCWINYIKHFWSTLKHNFSSNQNSPNTIKQTGLHIISTELTSIKISSNSWRLITTLKITC